MNKGIKQHPSFSCNRDLTRGEKKKRKTGEQQNTEVEHLYFQSQNTAPLKTRNFSSSSFFFSKTAKFNKSEFSCNCKSPHMHRHVKEITSKLNEVI